jgi:hypothetical protein
LTAVALSWKRCSGVGVAFWRKHDTLVISCKHPSLSIRPRGGRLPTVEMPVAPAILMLGIVVTVAPSAVPGLT